MRLGTTVFLTLLFLPLISQRSVAQSPQWHQTNGPYGGTVQALFRDSQRIYAGTWAPGPIFLQKKPTQPELQNAAVAPWQEDELGLYFSTDSGFHWTRSSLESASIRSIGGNDSILFAGTESHGLYHSFDRGEHWTFDSSIAPSYSLIWRIMTDGAKHLIYVALPGWDSRSFSLYSADNGRTWDTLFDVSNGVSPLLVLHKGSIYKIETSSSISSSTDGGYHWTINNTLPDQVKFLEASDSVLYIADENNIYRSVDKGATWLQLPFNPTSWIGSLRVNGAVLTVTIPDLEGMSSYLQSFDGGFHWESANSGTFLSGPVLDEGPVIFTGYFDEGVRRSTDRGLTWSDVSDGITDKITNMFGENENEVYASCTHSKLFRSTDRGEHWIPLSFPLFQGVSFLEPYSPRIESGVIDSNRVFVGTAIGLYKSTNHGSTFGLLEYSFLPLGTQFGGSVDYLANDSGILYALSDGRCYRSENHAVSWISMGLNSYTYPRYHIYSLAAGKNGLLHATVSDTAKPDSMGIYRSPDYGTSWSWIRNVSNNLTFLKAGNRFLFAHSRSGIYRSTDNAATWHRLGDRAMTNISSVWVNGNIVFITTEYPSSSYVSMDEGGTFEKLQQTPVDGTSLAFFAADSTAFLGTQHAGVWAATIGKVLGVANGDHAARPQSFKLFDNYPNPFNPQTTISFSIPEASHASLIVYNLLGQKIATLADELFMPGSYSRTWNAANIPSGVYYYRLEAGKYSETRKLTLVR